MEYGYSSKESITVEFGQYEPLTRRLHNLLKEYRDGFSVPKELIQNAEDAGATEVCFLYDERQNFDARTGLISDKLGQFQGPALWAFNNAKFTDNDFCNIRKLGGATKEEDTTKVGKFGLGFNSVYNLTDLPSFISGNQAVIFDPHSTYLGRHGLSTDLKRETDSRWRNQLKPFDGVFGCTLNSTGPICNGTLFRFPLRTKQQAQRSEIKDLSYSHQQMQEFFTVFAKYAGNLLLFTQNVQSVSFYFLPESGKPEQGERLIDIRKEIIYKHLIYHDQEEDAHNMNILKYSSEVLSGADNNELEFIAEQNKIEVKFAKHAFNRACQVEPTTNNITWQISWSVGNTDARKFASSSHLKGLVPLAAVAIPLKMMNTNSKSLCPVSDCGKGFYRKGHLFCFMPLPITTNHRVHINATFAVTSDRRQLCMQSADDTDSAEADWNRVLQTHVIGDAWAYALQNLCQLRHINENVYYDLWPQSMESFYRTIVEKNMKVFCCENGKKWSSYNEMLLLERHLRNDKKVGTIALSVIIKYCNGEEGWVIDLPTSVLDNFLTCGFQEAIDRRTMSQETFFKMFFSKITDRFLSGDERNKLTCYALLSSNHNLREMVKNNRCIPTKPNGRLKMPSELVNPYGQAAKLYSEEEEVFPNGNVFSDHGILKALESLGMTRDELSSEKITERAYLIQKNKSVHLSKNLMKYLNRDSTYSPNSRRFERYYDIQVKLQSMKILPVLQKPVDWPGDWKGDSNLFSLPTDLYQTDVANLVGCCENILDRDTLEVSSSGSDILKWLGVNSRDNVQIGSALNQLQCIHAENVHLSKRALRKLSDVCHTVYRYLDDYCISVKQHRTANKIQLQQDILKSSPIILLGNKLVEPKKMVFNLLVPLKPHLYEVDEELSQLYPHFLKAVGVRDHFGSTDILDVMKSIKLCAQGSPLSGEMLRCFCRAVQVLVDTIGTDGSIVPEVLLPNIDGHLHKANQLCLNDCGWIRNQRNMLFLHPNIAPKDGQALGVRTKREASLANHITAIPQARGFGQHEPLTSRLKRILDGYPKDVSILRELLQNADDAGATELVFIKDFRHHPTTRVFGDEWKQLQGPALCVFNNSHFTEEDFIGIQSLGEGSKGHDPLKTGQYGVGFNVVYHLTDVPSFMTVGPGTEKTLCVLDPHQCYTPRTEERTPGIQFKDLHDLRQTYKDVFNCYFEETVMNTGQGTLFRFPLRTANMAEISKISHDITTTSQLEEMLESFKDEAWSSMLFLTSVKKISIASVESNGKLSVEYSVGASLPNADREKIQTYISRLKSQLSQHDLVNMVPFQVQITKRLWDSKNGTQNWLIIHQVGFDISLPIPEDIAFYWRQKAIQLLPRGGVAVPLNLNQHCRGRLFCVLPLPKLTGLPIHINGHFSLGHEARRDLWQGTNDYRVQWNKHITEAIICPAYIAALQTIQTLCFPSVGSQMQFEMQVSNYYKLFPQLDKTTDSYVKLLVKAVYTSVAKNHLLMFPVLKPHIGAFLEQSEEKKMKIDWAPITVESGFPGYFNTTGLFLKDQPSSNPLSTGIRAAQVQVVQAQETQVQKDKRMLVWILKDLGMKIIESATHIQRQFDKTDFKDHVSGTTPHVVRSFLQSNQITHASGCQIGELPKLVSQTLIRSVENVKLLTKFCQMEGKFENTVIDLPLMVTQSQILSRFSEDTEYLVTKYHDLIPKSAGKVLHESLVPMYTQLDLPQTRCLRHMDIVLLTQLLDENLDTQTFKTGQPTLWLGTPGQIWICRLWQFLSSEVKEQFKRLKSEKIKARQIMRSDKKMENDKDIAFSHLHPLKEWSLIPAFQTEAQVDGSLYLYPVKSSRHVVGLQIGSNDSFEKVLEKICLPKLSTSTFVGDNRVYFGESLHLCSMIVANMNDPESILHALSKTHGRALNLTVRECCTVLQYFDGNMEILMRNVPDLSLKLNSLWYFPSLSGIPVCINQYAQVQVVTDSCPYIPEAGLHNLFNSLGRTFIIHKYSYEKILKYLKLQNWSRERAYTEVIIPNLMSFCPDDRMKHLLHIRDVIVPNAFSYKDERQKLLDSLSRTPFITYDGQDHTASDFYSQKIAEFREMCPHDSFLPRPFNEDDWQYLLECIGLKCHVTDDDFVQFAKMVERISQHGVTHEVVTKSQLLVEHLQRRDNLTQEGLLKSIRNIKFTLPCDIGKETTDGGSLTSIHSQYENAGKLVSYTKSCSPQFYLSTWTSCPMWTKEADICKYLGRKDAEKARRQLDVTEEPSVDVVVGHLQNISNALKKKDVTFKKQRSSLLEQIFLHIYGQLKDHKQNITMSSRLLPFPTIYLVDECEVVHATDVVLEMDQSEIIPGYIFRAPVFFGSFYSLFEALGAQKRASANTYALVLQKLFKMTQGQQLHPNEVKIVGHTLSNLIKCQSQKETANIQTDALYLPNTECVLTDAASLVYNDKERLAERLINLKLTFFLGFEAMGLRMYSMPCFPDKYQMIPLSKTVQETLSPVCLQHVSHSGSAHEYEQKIKSSEFIKGILRICNHQSREFTSAEATKIEKKLTSIEIRQVEGLETVLEYRGETVPGSQHKQECYISTSVSLSEEDKNEIVTVYLNAFRSKEEHVLFKIATAIDTLTQQVLGRFTSVVEKMLASEPEAISGILDDCEVKKYSYKSSLSSTVYPRVGTLIPDKFHWMLDNSFTMFCEGEYVGLDVFDPFLDENEARGGDNSLPVYVYAIVMKVEDDSSPMTATYLVEVEDEVIKSVSATMLYKFYREKENTTKDLVERYGNLSPSSSAKGKLHDILKDIRQQLQSAWDMLNPSERNRVRLRLLSHWHPDRNPDNVQLCTAVCQHIGMYIQRLENGETLDIDDQHQVKVDSSFYEEVTRRTNLQRAFRHSGGSCSSASCHHATRNQAYPHLGEAQRWLRQGKSDLDAAREALSSASSGHHNWTCYKAHQAAEKALKAVLFTVDSVRADELKVHVLPEIARGLDTGLQLLARKLHDEVKNNNINGLRYPDRSAYPRIPDEEYSSSHAKVFFKLAEMIVNTASQKVCQ